MYTDINFLISRSRMCPLPGGHCVTLTPSSSTLIVSNLNPSIKDFVLRLHFEKFTSLDSVTDVQMLGSNQALVTFKSFHCKYDMYARIYCLTKRKDPLQVLHITVLFGIHAVISLSGQVC